jgi:hypothetical protein
MSESSVPHCTRSYCLPFQSTAYCKGVRTNLSQLVRPEPQAWLRKTRTGRFTIKLFTCDDPRI